MFIPCPYHLVLHLCFAAIHALLKPSVVVPAFREEGGHRDRVATMGASRLAPTVTSCTGQPRHGFVPYGKRKPMHCNPS
jgi:hypothetical protein